MLLIIQQNIAYNKSGCTKDNNCDERNIRPVNHKYKKQLFSHNSNIILFKKKQFSSEKYI